MPVVVDEAHDVRLWMLLVQIAFVAFISTDMVVLYNRRTVDPEIADRQIFSNAGTNALKPQFHRRDSIVHHNFVSIGSDKSLSRINRG